MDDASLSGDVAQHVVGQRYFIADAWRWPLLKTVLLDAPDGVNISLTDSIPFAALIAKLFRHALPPHFTAIFPWLALAYLAQPVAAVFTLRCAGEQRVAPAFAVSVMAICTPTLLFRVGHIALCSHFLILTAIGLYFRIVKTEKRHFWSVLFLIASSLLIHPYLLLMVAAVLLAAPITLRTRRKPAWRDVTGSLAICLMIVAILAVLLGYGGQSPDRGFGVMSMNALSPIYPAFSAIYAWFFGTTLTQIDATGFQYEGYQYLGAGLLFLILVAFVSAMMRRPRDSMRLHAGLWIVCVALASLALSNRIYVGHISTMATHAPAFMNQLRSSGRFFWPVTYVLLIGSVCATARLRPSAAGTAMLLVATVLQLWDTSDLRRAVRDAISHHAQIGGDGQKLRAILGKHRELTIWPTIACGQKDNEPEFVRVILAASDTAIPVNTMYVARQTAAPRCDIHDTVGTTLRPGELRLFMPHAAAAAPFIVPDGSDRCRALGAMSLCSLDALALSDLPTASAGPLFPIGVRVAMSAAETRSFAPLGWSEPEQDGAWAIGNEAILFGRLAQRRQDPLVLTVWGHGLVDAAGASQDVVVILDRAVVAEWRVAGTVSQEYTAVLPADLLTAGPHLIRFQIARPASVSELGPGADRRETGFFLEASRLASRNQ